MELKVKNLLPRCSLDGVVKATLPVLSLSDKFSLNFKFPNIYLIKENLKQLQC